MKLIKQIHYKKWFIYLLKPKSMILTMIMVSFYTIYNKLFLPPVHLRHIPYVGFFTLLINLWKGHPYSVLSKKIFIPLLNKENQIYMKRDAMGWVVEICRPEDAKILFLKTDVFPKANIDELIGSLRQDFVGGMNNITFASEKKIHKKHRMILNPAFHRSSPVIFFTNLSYKTFNVIDNTIHQPIDISNLMERFTLDAIGKAGFDFNFNAITNENNEWVDVYRTIKHAVQNPLFALFPFLDQYFLWLLPKRKEKHLLNKKFQNMLQNIIEHKRHILNQQKINSVNDSEKDLLTLMLEGELAGEGSLTNDEIRSDLNIFFLAGHDTTASSISSVIYYLAKNTKVQQCARDEVIKVFGDDPKDIIPTFDQLKDLTYLNQIIKETIRLSGPAVTTTPRVTAKDTVLSGVLIPKGTDIVVNIFDLHHNPYVWKNPELFNPERFIKGGEADEKLREGYSWAGFGNGPRMCIGMNFSLTEQRVFLSCLLRKYEFSLPKDSIHKDVLITNTIGVIAPKNLGISFKRRY